MLNMIRAYRHYPYHIPVRVKFFNLFRYFVRIQWFEEWIARRIFQGSDFWKKAVPPIYFYQPNTFRRTNRDGIHLELDLSNLVDHAIFFGVPEELGWQKLFSLAKPEAVVFDVGANIGFLTLRFASICKKGFVYSFEPSRKNFERLRLNVALNQFSNVKISQFALGERTESKHLYEVFTFNTGANRILDSASENDISEVVSVDTLDHMVTALDVQRLDILKIDVEGYELFVLRGGHSTIQRFKPILFIEVADDNLRHHNLSSRDVLLFIRQMNYKIVDAKTMQPIEVSTQPIEVSTMKIHTDVLCFPNHND